MKLKKLFLFAAVAIASVMTSCSSSDDFTPGQPAGKNNVYFADNSNVTMALTQKSFDVTLERADASSALSVPVEVVNAGDIFTLSSTTAEFAAGAKTATISVSVADDMKLNTAYGITLRIPEEYTNPYAEQSVYPIYSVNVMKEDYAVFSNGIFIDGFWTDEQWEVVIEYSPSQDLYRVKSVYEEGYNLYFKMNKDTKLVTITNSIGQAVTKWASGIVHSSYGAISGDTTDSSQGAFQYVEDPEDGNFIYLPFKWTVSAGSFGVYPCYIVLE